MVSFFFLSNPELRYNTKKQINQPLEIKPENVHEQNKMLIIMPGNSCILHTYIYNKLQS